MHAWPKREIAWPLRRGQEQECRVSKGTFGAVNGGSAPAKDEGRGKGNVWLNAGGMAQGGGASGDLPSMRARMWRGIPAFANGRAVAKAMSGRSIGVVARQARFPVDAVQTGGAP